MSDPKRSSHSERIGAGKTIPMPDYRYQGFSGKSGGASSGKPAAQPQKKIQALQNFVPAP